MPLQRFGLRWGDRDVLVGSDTSVPHVGWIDHWNSVESVFARVKLATEWTCLNQAAGDSDRNDFPMLRDVAEPGDARGLEAHTAVEAARNSQLDDGLLLLVQQGNHLPLRPDRPLQSPIRPFQKPGNGPLFDKWHRRKIDTTEVAEVQVLAVSNKVRCCLQDANIAMGFE
jgi:hypothetical protein